jgi:septal ring factor EnvC (AmiA/AmiB activator)
MVGKVLGTIGVVALFGILTQTLVTTYYLAKIDIGLNSSLDSTRRLVSVEHAIIDKNKALADVIQQTAHMDQQLQTTLETTQTIEQHILRINDLNAATLTINRRMAAVGAAGTRTLSDVSSAMASLNQATMSLGNYLAVLRQVVMQDRANLDLMKQYTDEMNQKTPGVAG